MKKLNKLVALLVAMAMVLSLGVVSAFAAGQRATDEDHPASANLTKVLKVPTGTTVNNETFTFTFTQEEDPETPFALSGPYSITLGASNKVSSVNGLDTYVGTVAIPGNVSFPEAGVYTYTLRETYTEDATGTKKHDVTVDENTTKTYKYDTADAQFYTVKFGIATKADGTTYVESIGVYDKDGNKVNAGDPEEGQDANGFRFENQITTKIEDVDPEGKTEDPDNTNDKKAFDLTKTVTLAENSAAAPAQAFSFNVVLNKSALDETEGEVTYTAWIVKPDGSKTAKDLTTGATGNEVKLYDGDRLVMEDVDVGVSYLITEASYPAFTTNDNMTDVAYVTDNGTTKGFMNEYDSNDDPATGLSINNLPFIVLALVAIGGLCAYVIVRRRDEDNA